MKARLTTQRPPKPQKKKRAKKQKKGTDLLAALCFAVALALLFSSVGATAAKYVGKKSTGGMATAAPVYFTSDKLTEDAPYFQINEPDGGSVEISVLLANYVDSLRKTPDTVSISYSCWAENAQGEKLSEKTGSLTAATPSKQVSLSLTKEDFGDEGEVTVIAQTASPYVKTIRARFGFQARQYPLRWETAEQGNAFTLLISGGDGGDVTVSWAGAPLVRDPANALLQTGSATSVSFTVQPGRQYALSFFKTDPSASCSVSLSGNSFTVS